MLRKVKYLAYLIAFVGGSLYGCGCAFPCELPKACTLAHWVTLWLNEDLFS